MSTFQRQSLASPQDSGGCLQLNADSKEDLVRLKQISRKALKRIKQLVTTVPGGITTHKKRQVFMHVNDMTRYLRDKLTPGQTAVDYTFVISDWSMEIALDYLAPLWHLFKLAILRIKTVGYCSKIAKEERLAFHKHCRNLARKIISGPETDDQQVLPSAISPSAETYNQRVFPFVKLPSEIQDLVLAKTSLVSPPQRGIQTLVPAYAEIRGCCGKCGPGPRCWCPAEAAYSPTCKCNPSTSSLFLVDHAIHVRSQDIYYTHNTFNLGGHTLDSLSKEIAQIPEHIFPRL